MDNEALIAAIRIAGQYLIDTAQNIVTDTDNFKDLRIHIYFESFDKHVHPQIDINKELFV